MFWTNYAFNAQSSARIVLQNTVAPLPVVRRNLIVDEPIRPIGA